MHEQSSDRRSYAVTTPSVVVKPVTTKADKKAFIRFQYQVYEGFPNFVPPLEIDRKHFLDVKRNPWFQFGTAQLFLAQRAGKIVGRIAAIEDPRFNEFHQMQLGWFGLFECIDDISVAQALFHAAETWTRERGLKHIMGPASFSSNGEWAFLAHGFEYPQAIMMPYNPPYYLQLAEACGYQKAKDLWAWEIDLTLEVPVQVRRIAEKIKQREGVVIRTINLKDWDNEVRRIKDIYNEVWEKNWGFVPMTDAEFNLLSKEFKAIIIPDLALFAEVNHEPVAFSLSVPDANQAIKKANGRLTTLGIPIGLAKILLTLRYIKRGRLIAMGIKKSHRKRGLDSVLFFESFERAKWRHGWKNAEIGWTLEDNHLVNRAIQVFGCKQYKTFRIYERAL